MTNRRTFLKQMGTAAALASLNMGGCTSTKKQPNVLFLAVDDLRPELGCYGHQMIKSPNIDKLASEGTIFEKSFCNIPVCGASRASLLTGIRPTRDRFVTYYTRMTEDAPGAVTIQKHFKEHGYYAVSLGKIAHHNNDNGDHWSEKPWHPIDEVPGDGPKNWRDYQTEENLKIAASTKDGRAIPWEAPDIPDNAYFDGKTADKAISEIERLSDGEKPFFIAAGFLKPHLPFNAPKKYWDLYDADKITLPDNYYRPENSPDAAFHNFGELRGYESVPPKGPVSDEMARKLIHGYYACVSYTDAQIGRILEALEKSGQADNTIVILWGDHGWNLGEHTLWCKHCNFKTSLRTPMILKAPGKKAGQRTEALAEFVDIFPTLCDLAGLPVPGQCQGESLQAVLDNPAIKGKEAVYSQWIKGATVTTQQYAYTEWKHDNGEVYARMLYDHEADPFENENISEKAENKALVEKMSKMLNEGPINTPLPVKG